MAFNTAEGRAEYIASAGQTVFTFSFKIYQTSDIEVYLTPTGSTPDDTADLLTEATDYNVVINGDLGGTVTLVASATLNDAITIVRELPTTRSTEYQELGDMYANTLNQDQDYQTYLSADQSVRLDRNISIPKSSQNVSTVLPTPEALKLIRWNVNADAFENIDQSADLTKWVETPTVTAGQTVITLTHQTKNASVYINGALLNPNSDYTTSGNTVTLVQPIDSSDDEVVLVGGDIFLDPPSTQVVYVPTITAMGSVDPVSTTTVIVQEEGRGGTFNYDASQSAVNNGGTIFNGWVREYSGAVNVKWFGAKGDGVTDDTVHFVSASSIGDIVFVPKVTIGYVVSAGVNTGDSVFKFESPNQIIGADLLNDLNGGIMSSRESTGSEMTDRLKALSSVDALYVKASGANFAIGLHQNDNQVSEYRIGPDDDGLYLLQGGFIGQETDPTIVVPTLTGTFVTTSSNSYTVTPNDTIDFTFRGTGFSFVFFADNRGGVWQFEVDGAIVAKVSTFSTVSEATKIVEVVRGLAETTHVVTATFLGDDPLNPPSGGISRGWFRYDYLATGTSNSTANLITIEDLVLGAVSKDILSQNSISDFAINGYRTDSGIGTGKWVPAHSAETGASRNIVTEVYIDGVLVDSDPSVSVPDPITARDIHILNQYIAFNTLDTLGNFPMWIGYIDLHISHEGLTVTHNIELQGDVNVTVGYLTMLASDSDHVDTAIFGQGEKFKPLATDDSNTTVSSLNNSGCFVDQSGDIAIAVDCNLSEALRYGNRIVPKDSVFLNQRSSTIMKMYWKFAEAEVLSQGSVYRIQNKYFIAGGLRYPKAI